MKRCGRRCVEGAECGRREWESVSVSVVRKKEMLANMFLHIFRNFFPAKFHLVNSSKKVRCSQESFEL